MKGLLIKSGEMGPGTSSTASLESRIGALEALIVTRVGPAPLGCLVFPVRTARALAEVVSPDTLSGSKALEVCALCTPGPQSSLLLNRETLLAQQISRQDMKSELGTCRGIQGLARAGPPGPGWQAQAHLFALRPPSWGTILSL